MHSQAMDMHTQAMSMGSSGLVMLILCRYTGTGVYAITMLLTVSHIHRNMFQPHACIHAYYPSHVYNMLFFIFLFKNNTTCMQIYFITLVLTSIVHIVSYLHLTLIYESRLPTIHCYHYTLCACACARARVCVYIYSSIVGVRKMNSQ